LALATADSYNSLFAAKKVVIAPKRSFISNLIVLISNAYDGPTPKAISGRHPESGHNVIYHEFAHKLDMLDGAADGTPPLRDRAEYRDWVLTCSREYLRLKHDTEKGKKSFLNAYGATNEAEFFAVATEQFFDQPRLMIEHAPDLYRVLQEYYRQDPSERVSRNNCTGES
jgi:Mlc titration factor MtfA (ptsG expression regulator)